MNENVMQQMNQAWNQAWAKMLSAGSAAPGAAPNAGAMPAWMPGQAHGDAHGDALAPLPLQWDSEKIMALAQGYVQQAQEIWTQGVQAMAGAAAQAAPSAKDHRFAAPAWDNPMSNWTVQMYLLTARTLMQMVDCAQADKKTLARLRFATEQHIAATCPANFLALNPDAIQAAIDSQGQSIARGMQNLLHDLRLGHVSMTDESQFEVGRNVATTQGAVVFENDLFQLIEYKPLTKQVHEKPFLVIPPCINKYYILDLQESNSVVRYLVTQGHRTFVLSWRNPDAEMAHVTWDDYVLNAAVCAIEKVRTLCKARQINALGFCVGGTILGTALAVLAAQKKKPVASATLLTTLLDFSNTGVLDIFIDEASVQMRETQFAQGGVLKGKDLASTFSFLRPNELVWNYVVGNYLKGQTPPPFDLLYWNSDATNLPGPMYAWYLRNTYLENNLIKPGKCSIGGIKVDLSTVDIPMYIYGSREDHIVPIAGSYASTQLFKGSRQFVMGASGHIAGVINPPQANKRSHWLGKRGYFPKQVDAWMDSAKEQPGSWWPHWAAWLKEHGGKMIPAPKTYCAKAIEAAPGRYVKAKA